MENKRPHIVILGAGFGGMYTARELKCLVARGDADITIVNETNYFLFTPLLHEVATGSLSPRSVTEPLRELFAGTDITIYQGTVTSIDRDRRVVSILCANRKDEFHPEIKRDITYDYLIVATGGKTAYYGISGAEEHSYPLKTLADAIDIRHHIIHSFEKAALTEDPALREKLLSFVVVGGGPTGVEVVSELTDFTKGMVSRYYHNKKCSPDADNNCQPDEPRISLIHAGKELLQQFKPKLRTAATHRLQKDGVTLYIDKQVTKVTAETIELADKTVIPAATVIWAAGVTPAIPPFLATATSPAPALVANRLAVDEFFRLQGNDNIFVLGDVAGYADTTKGPTLVMLPMLAQVATEQAHTVAFNIKASLYGKKLRTFTYHSKGSMISIGQWFAMGEIFSVSISGPITWWIWRTVYLFKFISWKKRLRIIIDWTLNIFYPRDITNR